MRRWGKLCMVLVLASLLPIHNEKAHASLYDAALCALEFATHPVTETRRFLGAFYKRDAQIVPSEALGGDMFQHAISMQPRFSDFNMQGILRGSLYFDFACEAQLAQFKSRYGIRFDKYGKAGLKWNITDYRITFHEEYQKLEPFAVVANIIEAQGPRIKVEFSFWDQAHQLKYASGTIIFDLYNVAKKSYVSIDSEDMNAFQREMTAQKGS